MLQQPVTGLQASFWVCLLTSRQRLRFSQRDYCMLDNRRSCLLHRPHYSCLRRDKTQMNAQADGKELMPVHWAEPRMIALWAIYFFVQQAWLALWQRVV